MGSHNLNLYHFSHHLYHAANVYKADSDKIARVGRLLVNRAEAWNSRVTLLTIDRHIFHCMGMSLLILSIAQSTLSAVNHHFSRLIALSQLGLIGYLAIDFVAFSNGAGIHQWNVPVEQVKIFAQAS